MTAIASFPHCEPRVLHSPGVCPFCDKYPAKQEERLSRGIKFTDQLEPNEPLLPGEDRTAASADSWPGNRPEGYGDGVTLHSPGHDGLTCKDTCPDLLNGHYPSCPTLKEA